MLAVETEREPEKVSLVGTMVQSRFRKIGERVRRDIQNRERLVEMLAVFRVGSVSAVEKYDEAAIGRYGTGSGEIVDGARTARHFAEQTSVGELSSSLRDRCGREEKLAWGKCEERKNEQYFELGREPEDGWKHARNCNGSVSMSVERLATSQLRR